MKTLAQVKEELMLMKEYCRKKYGDNFDIGMDDFERVLDAVQTEDEWKDLAMDFIALCEAEDAVREAEERILR